MTDFGETTTPDEIAEEVTEKTQEERKTKAKEAWDTLVELAYGTNEEGTSLESVSEPEPTPSFTLTQEHHSESAKNKTTKQLAACACTKCEGFESGEPKTRCALCGCDILDHIASAEIQDTLLSEEDDYDFLFSWE